MKHSTLSPVVCMTLVAVLACSACGDDQDPSPSTTSATSTTPSETPDLSGLAVAPERLNFVAPSVADSVEMVLSLSAFGTGQKPVTVQSMTFTGDAAFSTDCVAPFEVNPGQEMGCTVRYQPNEESISSGVLEIATSSPRTPRVIVPLSGRFVRTSASWIGPQSPLFTPAGTVYSAPVTLRNTTPQAVQLERVTVRSLDGSEVWSLEDLDGGAVETPVDLAVFRPQDPSGSELVMNLTFAPNEARDVYMGVIEAQFSDGTQVSLSVEGGSQARGCLRAQPGEQLNFGQLFPEAEFAEMGLSVENCGVDPVVVYGVSSGEDVSLNNDPESAAFLVSLPFDHVDGVAQSPVRLEAGDSFDVSVVFAPLEERLFVSNLIFEHSAREPLVVDLLGRGRRVPNLCPESVLSIEGQEPTDEPVDVVLGASVVLDGRASRDPDGMLRSWVWSVEEGPEGSEAELETVEVDPDGLRTFTPDLPGVYVIALEHVDNYNTPSCAPAAVTLNVPEPPELTVQLVWDNPEDPDQTDVTGSDLDLHVAKVTEGAAWFQAPYDTYYANNNPFWDPETARVVVDDTNGAGPEEILLDDLADCQWYAVAVHQWRAQFGSAFATLRIFQGGELIFETEEPFEFSESGQWWDLLRIHAPSGTVLLTGLERQGDRPNGEGSAVEASEVVEASELCGSGL